MREHRHRSPLLCHSGAFNEEIWADKGRGLQSVTVGDCQSTSDLSMYKTVLLRAI